MNYYSPLTFISDVYIIFVIPTISFILIIQSVVPCIMIIITIRNGLHGLLQRVRAPVVDAAKTGPLDRDSQEFGEPVFLGPVDALKPEVSRRLS